MGQRVRVRTDPTGHGPAAAWTWAVLACCACGGTRSAPGASAPGEAGDGTAATGEAAATEPPSPTARETAEAAATRPVFDLDAWLAAVERDGPTDPMALRKRLEEAELRLLSDAPVEEQLPELCPGVPTTFGGVRRIDGQVDGDPEMETVVRILVEVAPQPGPRQRCEEVWLGLFDPAPGGPELLFVTHRRLLHCLLDERDAAVTAGFTTTEPAADAAFWMERQQIDACGTLVDYRYQRFVVRPGRDGLAVERSNTESTTYDHAGDP
ncbi:MAG: hypothetical protein JXB32_18890 [Deltaproteobacteria bacterium]|nr:hypothetical protein [Deltaproteobacteria bacterium]